MRDGQESKVEGVAGFGKFTSMEQVAGFRPDAGNRLHSATHEEIVAGATTDIILQSNSGIIRKGR